MNQKNLIPRYVPLAMRSAPSTMRPRHTCHPYRAPTSAFCTNSRPFLQPSLTATFALTATLDWPGFWDVVQASLRKKAFQRGTLRTYRQVLRSFRSYLVTTSPSSFHLVGRELARRLSPSPSFPQSEITNHQSKIPSPSSVTPNHVKAFISHLVDKQVSWSWQSTCVAVLRTAFDKLAGLSVTAGLVTPKRPLRLGDIVSSNDVARMIETLPSVRDRLIVGLLYGCGMKVGELCRLRWQDVNVNSRQLTIHFAGLTRSRHIPIPEALIPLLTTGVRQCPAGDCIFQGTRKDKPLSDRMIERIVRRAALTAGLFKEVCCMTLRHSYAVTMLRQSVNPRQLQENLGHQSLKTTLNYQRYILPPFSCRAFACKEPLAPRHLQAKALHETQNIPRPTNTPKPITDNALPPSHPLRPSSLSSPPLDIKPGTLDPIELPFPHISNGAQEFYALLKTCIRDRFLALRASAKFLNKAGRASAKFLNKAGRASAKFLDKAGRRTGSSP